MHFSPKAVNKEKSTLRLYRERKNKKSIKSNGKGSGKSNGKKCKLRWRLCPHLSFYIAFIIQLLLRQNTACRSDNKQRMNYAVSLFFDFVIAFITNRNPIVTTTPSGRQIHTF